MELLNQLEENINRTLENYELLTLEVEELKAEVDALKEEKSSLLEKHTHWESKIKTLLGVFSDASVTEENKEQSTPEQNNNPEQAAS